MNWSELKEDGSFLLANPDKDLSSKYHDAGSCWELIDWFRKALEAEMLRNNLNYQAIVELVGVEKASRIADVTSVRIELKQQEQDQPTLEGGENE